MPGFLQKLKQQVAEFWGSLDKSQKTRLYITSAVVIATVVIGIILLTRPSYVTLISSNDSRQIGEMKKILDDSKIWNKLDNDGNSIIVNKNDKAKARIAVSDKGFPKSGLTFEDAISMIGISTTESDKKHIWKQQEKAEIERMISSYDNIESAEVNVAVPEKTIFTMGDKEPPKPKAIVKITPREKLTENQVQGLVMLVSRSVENLDPKDVTVVDNNSNILNIESEDNSIDMANTQEKMRRDMEKHLQGKVYDYFSTGQFDGFDTIRVVANAILDFDKEKTQIKRIENPDDMDGGALLNSDILKENLENGAVRGEPGVGTNPGTANAPTYQIGDEENSSYKKSHEIKNFGYDETVKEQEKATGSLIPEQSTLALSFWYGQRVADDANLSNEFMNQARLAVSSATGIPVENISVTKLKLAPPEAVKKSTGDIIKEFISNYGVLLLLLVLIAALLIVTLRGRKSAGEPQLQELRPAAASASKYTIPEQSDIEIPEIEVEEKSEIKKQIDKFVKQKPEAVAQLLRNWLSDEWDG